MRVRSATVRALKTVAFIFLAAFVGASRMAAVQSEYASDHVLIKFKSTARIHVATVFGTNSYAALVRELNLPVGAELRETELTRLVREGKLIRGVQPSNKSALDLDHFMLLYLPSGFSVEECLARLKNNSSRRGNVHATHDTRYRHRSAANADRKRQCVAVGVSGLILPGGDSEPDVFEWHVFGDAGVVEVGEWSGDNAVLERDVVRELVFVNGGG